MAQFVVMVILGMWHMQVHRLRDPLRTAHFTFVIIFGMWLIQGVPGKAFGRRQGA